MSDQIINPEKHLPTTFHFTQSNLQDFVDCQRRFYLRYIAEQRWPAPLAEPQGEIELAMQRGSRFHQLVERHQHAIPMEVIRESAADDEAILGWLDQYEAVLDKLGPFEQRWVEASLSIVVADRPVLAKYDFIGLQDDHLLAIDWKTGRLPDLQRLEQRLQTMIYLLVLFRRGEALAGREIKQFDLYYAGVQDGSLRQFSVDSREAHRLTTQLQYIIGQVLAAREFPLTDDLHHCRFCVYRGLCERGVSPIIDEPESLDLDDLWLDLGDMAGTEIEF